MEWGFDYETWCLRRKRALSTVSVRVKVPGRRDIDGDYLLQVRGLEHWSVRCLSTLAEKCW